MGIVTIVYGDTALCSQDYPFASEAETVQTWGVNKNRTDTHVGYGMFETAGAAKARRQRQGVHPQVLDGIVSQVVV